MTLPRIAVTMGDPAGVGPEVCLKILGLETIRKICHPIIFGDLSILQEAAQTMRLPSATLEVADCLSAESWSEGFERIHGPAVVDFRAVDQDAFCAGQISANTGAASALYISKAIAAASVGQVAAITTGPINKEAIRSAGIRYPGHTEMLADLTGSTSVCMMQYSDAITCSFVTTHVGYAEVPKLLSQERILETLRLSHDALFRVRGRVPKMVACGLNPHAGENGLFGEREEERLIIPALEQARREGMDVEGPLPPDTVFLPRRRETTDCFICMYHDQGHIPLKALAFDMAVNVTLGLPIIRTSVDHGTALDIAWQGQASCSSMEQAVLLASRLATPSR